MKALIVYDSMYGNTEQIAKAIAGAAGGDACGSTGELGAGREDADACALPETSPLKTGRISEAAYSDLRRSKSTFDLTHFWKVT